MADTGTISRIGGLLKQTFADGVKEQQQKIADMRSRIGKPSASAWKAPGLYYEISMRIGGNRAAISPAASDDPIPTPSRQKEVLAQVFDRGYLGSIQMYEKDMLNTDKASFQSFMSHKTDEMKGITEDYLKCVNIDLSAGDGSGVLSLINAGTTSATQTLQVGTGAYQYGSTYLAANDLIDIYDSTLTTSRSAGAGLTVNSITKSTAGGPSTIVLSASVTTTTGDIVIRGKLGPNKAYIGPLGMLRNQGVTFQGLLTTTYPLLQSNRINMNGLPFTESVFENLGNVTYRASGVRPSEFWAGIAQYSAYKTTGYGQKRFMDEKLDKGFTTLAYDGKKVVEFIDLPSSVVMALDLDTIKFGTVAPWGPSELDGNILKFVPNFMAYQVRYREYGQMVYERPNASALAEGLAFDLTNPAFVF